MRTTLLSLCREVRALPGSNDLVVFGSMLSRPDTAGDLDVALNRPENLDHWPSEVRKLIDGLLRLGAYGGPYYGDLDLFVDTPDALMVRDGDCRSMVWAKHARGLRKSIATGEAFGPWYDREVAPRLASAEAPVPNHQTLVDAERARREAVALERASRKVLAAATRPSTLRTP